MELTTSEAAIQKGVSVRTVQAAILNGKLKARIYRPKGRARSEWRIRQADLDMWQPVTDPHEKGKRGGRPRKTSEE